MPFRFPSPAVSYRIILVLLLMSLLALLVIMAWTALVPFFMGAVIAYLLSPAVNFLDSHAPRWLRRTRLSRPLAIILMYIIVLGIVAGILSYFVPVVVGQGQVFIQVAPTYLEKIQGTWAQDVRALLEKIPPEIQTTVNDTLSKTATSVLSAVQRGIAVTITTVSQTISFILGLVIIPFWLFYILNDEEQVRRGFYTMIPEKARDDVHYIVKTIDKILGAYIRGQLLLCLVVGLMATIVLLVLRVELALLLGTLAGVFEIVPILGPYIGAIPAVIMALVKQPILGLWVALSFAAIQQIENIFLVPRISGKAVRFHPAMVMVIVVVGSQVGGILGILVAVPTAAMVRDVFRYLYLRTTDRGRTPLEAWTAVEAERRG